MSLRRCAGAGDSNQVHKKVMTSSKVLASALVAPVSTIRVLSGGWAGLLSQPVEGVSACAVITVDKAMLKLTMSKTSFRESVFRTCMGVFLEIKQI